MKAVFYDQFGAADVLRVGDLPVPDIAADQVLVQVAAAAVNPIDRRLRAGELQEFFKRTFPIIPGWDVAGRIVKTGSDVTNWKVGDEVVGLAFTWSLQHGTYAEFVPISASAIARKPGNLRFIESAALPLVSLTAWQSLAETADVKHGQSVFIQAGAGGLGSVAISMANYLGAKVYTTTRERNFEYVRALGAHHPIDYVTANYAQVIKRLEPDGVDMVLELLSDHYFVQTAIRLTKDGGTVVYMNNEPPEMPEITQRSIKSEWLHHRADGAMLAKLMDLYATGDLKMPKIEVMPLEHAVAAHQRSESGRTQGKIVLHVQDL